MRMEALRQRKKADYKEIYNNNDSFLFCYFFVIIKTYVIYKLSL